LVLRYGRYRPLHESVYSAYVILARPVSKISN